MDTKCDATASAPRPIEPLDASPRPTGTRSVRRPTTCHPWALHRRLYDWVISFSRRRHSTTALFVLSFAESSFFPVPPDVLLGPLCLGNRRRALWFATVTAVASILGAYLGYYIGFALTDLALMIPGVTEEAIESLAGEFESRGRFYVFVAALTPIPFKLLTIAAGFAEMDLLIFGLACLVGRSLRFYGVAGVFWLIGPRALPLIDRYFNLLCIVFVVLLLAGFAAIKLVG